jgi:hypothetical protein
VAGGLGGVGGDSGCQIVGATWHSTWQSNACTVVVPIGSYELWP